MNKELAELRKPGRPCKYTPATVERLLSAVEAGLTLKQACIAAGIGETTLHEWRKEYPDLKPRLEAARERAREAALRAIRAAGEKDWRAHEAWLRLSFQSDYRQSNTKVEVNTNAQAGVGIVCTEEQRMRLIALRERPLAEAAGGRQHPD